MKNLELRPFGGGDPKYTCRDWKDFLDKCKNTDDAVKLAVNDGCFSGWLKEARQDMFNMLDGIVGSNWLKWREHEFLAGVFLMSKDADRLTGKLVELASKAFAYDDGNDAEEEIVKCLEDNKDNLLAVYDDEDGFDAELNFWQRLCRCRTAILTGRSDTDNMLECTCPSFKSSALPRNGVEHPERGVCVRGDNRLEKSVASNEEILSPGFACRVHFFKGPNRAFKNRDWLKFYFGSDCVCGIIWFCHGASKVKPGNWVHAEVLLKERAPVAKSMGFKIREGDCDVGEGIVDDIVRANGMLTILLQGQRREIGVVFKHGDGWSVSLNVNCACLNTQNIFFPKWVMYGVVITESDVNANHPCVEFPNGEMLPVRVLYNALGDYKFYCK